MTESETIQSALTSGCSSALATGAAFHGPKAAQRGFSLIVAVAVVSILMLVGLLVVDVVALDTRMAAANRGSQSALQIAEAGLVWGMNELRQNYGFDTQSPNFAGVLGQPLVDDSSCPAGQTCCTDSSCQIFGWRQLHTTPRWIDYGGGRFRVVAQDDDDDGDLSTDTNQIILLRAMGEDFQSKRLLEIAIGLDGT